MASPHKPIHILCLGNSLTEGYTCYGTQFHPYTTTLHHHLTTTLPNPITVLNDGLSGDEILGPNMKPRLLHSLSAAKYSNIQFDWIIILAGRNDLPNPGNTVSDVYAGLKELIKLGKSRQRVQE
ncbi:hypothetical protein HK097_007426 [Rhizophlyctis rosea]|uniref:SGNH hydrolase-type esterase domain-containing protein n=1 Tax=Rhizophlyctis rosea TaxID=64517 RepID=A0AAD5SBN9_9FUNG|nr:hypothetical protein HK097_007426 [Rhizophlyctis rosea]